VQHAGVDAGHLVHHHDSRPGAGAEDLVGPAAVRERRRLEALDAALPRHDRLLQVLCRWSSSCETMRLTRTPLNADVKGIGTSHV
jgi:hypothetical protein